MTQWAQLRQETAVVLPQVHSRVIPVSTVIPGTEADGALVWDVVDQVLVHRRKHGPVTMILQVLPQLETVVVLRPLRNRVHRLITAMPGTHPCSHRLVPLHAVHLRRHVLLHVRI